MSEPNSERIITPMPKSLVERIDDYRFQERIPSRAEAIRRLVEKGLPQMIIVRVIFADSHLGSGHAQDLEFFEMPRMGEHLAVEEKGYHSIWKVERVGHKGASVSEFRPCVEVSLVEPSKDGSPPIGEFERMIAGR